VKKVFVDTSYFVALANGRDEFHRQAKAFSDGNIQPTTAILLELGTKFSRADWRSIFLGILEILEEDDVEIVQIDSSLIGRGIELFRKRPDKHWSLADCISFEVMRDHDITEAVTTDEHFEQAEFIALLRNPGKKDGSRP